MPETVIRHAVKTAITLMAFAVVGTALLAYIFGITRGPIAKSEAEARMELFRQIVPDTLHDNDLLKDTIRIAPDPLLGNRDTFLASRARLAGKPVAVILEAVAPDGYSGDIKLLIAVRNDGSIIGVRVLAHKETPGLGDYIDIARSDWIRHFEGQSLALVPDGKWKVIKDGGQFDYMAGATITPRAVVKAVHKALQYYAAHKETLFADYSPETYRAKDTGASS